LSRASPPPLTPGQPKPRGRLRRLSLSFTHFAAYWLAFTLLAVGHWIARKYGEPTFEQLLYHLQFGANGLVETDPRLIQSFVRNCVGAPLLLAVLAFVFEKLTVTAHDIGWRATALAVLAIVQRSTRIALRGWMSIWYRLFKLRLPLLLVLVGAAYFLTQISLWGHIGQLMGEDILARYYVEPKTITPPEGPKRNLVLVYAESLETAYSNPALFGEDLLKGLQSPAGHSFARLQQTPGSGWTIAGIVTSQCGIPLRPVIFEPNDVGDAGAFLPNITCLGDILKAHGYTNVFMGGASLSFAGKDKFLKSHGYDEAWGKEAWQAAGNFQMSWWGLYDDDLVNQAKKRLDALVAAGQPFNLTLLTLDTHAPDGLMSPYCAQRGGKWLTDNVRCTAELIADLRAHAQKKGYLANTDFVVVGDHLAMVNQHFDTLLKHPDRTVFNQWHVQPGLTPNRDTIYHFDVFPTVLYSLGFRFPDNRLGLGGSGFGPPPALPADHDPQHFLNHVLNYSPKYLEFWHRTEKASSP
jgi:phosphoglycerol transferase